MLKDSKFTYNKKIIGLPVDLQDLPETVDVEGVELMVKSDFHVTLVAMYQIAEKNNIENPEEFSRKVTEDFNNFIKTNDLVFRGFTGEFRFVQNSIKKTLVGMCNIENLDKFFIELNNKYNLRLETPPTHVTLYTLQKNEGIFLTDSRDLAERSKIVPKPSNLQL